jgi:U3 small nucleolar RNA-associated protein 20
MFLNLIAQLKVNLRPIWSPAAGALSSLASQFGEVVWALLFAELKGLDPGGDRIRSSANPNWMADVDGDGTPEEQDGWETERTWRDPSAHKLSGVVRKMWDDRTGINEFTKVWFSLFL